MEIYWTISRARNTSGLLEENGVVTRPVGGFWLYFIRKGHLRSFLEWIKIFIHGQCSSSVAFSSTTTWGTKHIIGVYMSEQENWKKTNIGVPWYLGMNIITAHCARSESRAETLSEVDWSESQDYSCSRKIAKLEIQIGRKCTIVGVAAVQGNS